MGAKKNIQLLPGRLMPGDTIGIIAPAGHFDRKKFDKGIVVLKAMGFRIIVPDDLLKKKGYLAGPDIHRASLVNRCFSDSEIKAVICARGGFGSMRILPLLDYELIKKNPKIFVGFSDISALLSAFYTKCGMVTFHGPLVTTLGDASQKTKEAMVSAFSSGTRLEMKPEMGITIKRGLVSAPVSGGNLTTLCHLVGTPFKPEFKGHILFLEDKGEAGYRIDRMLTQMKLAGCFDGIAGLALGSFEDCGETDELFGIVDSIFKEYNIPILAGFEAGHGKNNITIPMGIKAVLDADKKLLSFNEPATILSGARD
jgi:muramoyltetrapeptide carboxypeptidase